MLHRLTLAVLAVLAVLALALPANALASDAAYEPNNGIQEAYGPLLADTDYDGVTSSEDDVDWYILYVSGPGELGVKLTNTDDSLGASVQFRLLDANGERLNSNEAHEGKSSEIVYTTPGPGTYYVRVSSYYASNTYRLRLTGPLTGGPRPGPAEVTPNNNPDIGSAFGPLLGGHAYGGSIDAYYEQDWFYFYTAGPGAFDIALMNSGDGTSGSVSFYLGDENGDRLSSGGAHEDTIGHITYTAAGPEKFFIEVDSSYTENHYQFRIDPAGLLTTVAPPAPPAPPVVPAPGAPTITSGPPSKTTSGSAAFGFTGEAGVSFECKVTGTGVPGTSKSWSGCNSPAQYTGFGLGAKTFRVRAVRSGKNSGAATWTWEVVAAQRGGTGSGGHGKSHGHKRLLIPTTRRKATFRAVCRLSKRCKARVKIVAGKKVLARGRYAVPPHRSRKVRIRLTKLGRRVLSHTKRVPAKLKIVDTRTHKREAVAVVLKRR